jgi:hypothetical protein
MTVAARVMRRPELAQAATAAGPGTALEVKLIDLLAMRPAKRSKVPRASSSSLGVK